MRRTAKARVVDGRELTIKQLIHRVNVTILTLWVSVKATLSLAVLPGIDLVLIIIDSKSMRERLGGNIMASPRDNSLRDAEERVTFADKIIQMLVATKGAQSNKE